PVLDADAAQSMSAPLRKRPMCCVAANRRDVPKADIRIAAKLAVTRSPRRRRQAAQAARSGRAHARRLVVKLAAETPEMGKFPVNFPVSREFGAETGSHPTASSGTAHM